MTAVGALVAAVILVAGPAVAAAADLSAASGTLHVPAMDVPFSPLASAEARRAFVTSMALARSDAASARQDVPAIRASTSAYFAPLVDQAARLYPVTVKPERIGGVETAVVTPKSGVAPRNRRRILIDLRGGGFFAGTRAGGLAEAIPIAGLGRIEVVTIDYAQAPESKFPAASRDVLAVYRVLLKRYPAKAIGIYGASAGAVLTAETIAWLEREGLPLPGAIAMVSGSAGGWAGGDSTYFAPLAPVTSAPESTRRPEVSDALYFSAADMTDPLVAPIRDEAIMARFPPTLVITGTRDVSLSVASHTHAELVRLGVQADLHVWEGVGHAFFTDPTLPESKQAYAVIVSFFDRHLAR